MKEGEQFLHEKYPDLQKSFESNENRPGAVKPTPVERAVRVQEKKTGKKVKNNPEERIGAYLDRLERLALDSEKKQPRKMFGSESRPRALLLLREMVMSKYVRPNKEKMSQGAAAVEEHVARELGMEAHYGPQELEQRGEIAVTDLEKSLDIWISYLSDMNEPYPTWFRYYAFRNVLDLGDYDKDKGEFTKRSKGSTRLFPDIDRGALAYVEQMIEASKDQKMLERLKKAQCEAAQESIPVDQLITKEKAKTFAKLSFSKQYAEAIKQAGEIAPEMREEEKGEWVRYQRDTDPTALWASLQNKGTAWCTKGFATAETQLKGGDFWVYYTLDRQGKPTIPRIAIRMQEDSIGEVRGVADNDQNLEGKMTRIAENKMNQLPGAEKYRKASADMKKMTAIEKKAKAEQPLTKEELTFLYELDSPIEFFGYKKDPRIEEIRGQRKLEHDLPVIFECQPDQIACRKEEIRQNTVAYIGEWTPEVMNLMPENVKYIYEKFPDRKVFCRIVETNPEIKDGRTAVVELEKHGFKISDWGKDILEKTKFSGEKQELQVVSFSVESLGFPQGARYKDIIVKAKQLGLELCPAELVPQLRLQYKDQPDGEWLIVAMDPITAQDGLPSAFDLYRIGSGLWLGGDNASPEYFWFPDGRFVFVRPRKYLHSEL